MKGVLHAAWRNYIRNLRRYRVLLLALVLITAALTMVLGLVLGMQNNLYKKASRYFTGNLVITGYTGDGTSVIERPEMILEAISKLEEYRIPLRAVALRSTYYEQQYIELFYSGYYIKQRRLVGVEWSRERPILRDFDFTAGDVPDDGDEQAVLISTATASRLNIDVGDELILSIRSDRGRTNTVDLIVRGIFTESSFFGYQTYVHRHTLNRLREAPEDTVNEIGVYLKEPISQEQRAAQMLIGELKKVFPVFGIMQTRDEYVRQANKDREFREYGIVTVGAQLEEIEDLLGAVTLISGAAIFAFLLIVIVGVGNTFTMIIWERTREIGTLRALGLQCHGVVFSFLSEASFLGLSGIFLGLLAGVAVLEFVRLTVHIPPNMVTSLFFTQGRLYWILPFRSFLIITALVIGACILGSFNAALRAGRLSPVQAMNYRKK